MDKKKIRGQETKESILREATDLFADDIYNRVSMKEIAIRAGIKPATIYNHFKSKEELLDEIIIHYSDLLRNLLDYEKINQKLKQTSNPKLILERMIFFENNEIEYEVMRAVCVLLRAEYSYPEKLTVNPSYDLRRYYEYVFQTLVERGDVYPQIEYHANVVYRVVAMYSLEKKYSTTPASKPEEITFSQAINHMIHKLLTEEGKERSGVI